MSDENTPRPLFTSEDAERCEWFMHYISLKHVNAKLAPLMDALDDFAAQPYPSTRWDAAGCHVVAQYRKLREGKNE